MSRHQRRRRQEAMRYYDFIYGISTEDSSDNDTGTDEEIAQK